MQPNPQMLRELREYPILYVDDEPDNLRIFDPFVTSKPVGEGTGLGLDIARQLVRRNNGDIEVQSVPGRTEFSVSLPIAEKADVAPTTAPGHI